ncbi:uracil phosphoribosyltransferase [Candidatus Dependentiae bacterium]|nr:uracil phosphoribosyltransferase [Candidatus Dependentiae bacterium]
MKKVLLSILRDKNTDIKKFREVSEKLALILAGEVGEFLEKEEIKIDTPIDKANGIKFKNDIILIPILRAALSLVPAFLMFFEKAKVGFLGLKRDEKTAIAKLYYKNFPKIKDTDDVIILDPMIATGGSGSQAIKLLKEDSVKEEKIIFVSVICAKPGVDKIKREYPKVKIIYVAQDKKLNDQQFIIPGLGDFGDRYFGTL